MNVCFKYQLNFFTLDFLKGYSWPPIFYFPVVTILCYNINLFVVTYSSKFPSSFGDGTVEGCTTQLPTEGIVPVPLARPVHISFMT